MQPKNAATAKVAQPAPTRAARPALKLVGPPKYSPPCKQPQDHDPCDLEAQWKAADAARDAANWSWYQMVFSASGLAGLILSLYYTRKAVLAAESASEDADDAIAIAARNADAADQQVNVARETARRQLRAYLWVKGVRFLCNNDDPSCIIQVSNDGQTPAAIMKVVLVVYFAVEKQSPIMALDYGNEVPLTVYHGSPTDIPFGLDSEPDTEEQGHVWAMGRVNYIDVFGQEHNAGFSYRSSTKVGWKAARGNFNLVTFPMPGLVGHDPRDATSRGAANDGDGQPQEG